MLRVVPSNVCVLHLNLAMTRDRKVVCVRCDKDVPFEVIRFSVTAVSIYALRGLNDNCVFIGLYVSYRWTRNSGNCSRRHLTGALS